jgi:hypothetical protein
MTDTVNVPLNPEAAGPDNVRGVGRPAPTDGDLRMVQSLAAFAAGGARLEPGEVMALRVLEHKALEAADRVVVERLLAPAVAAERAEYEAAEPERKAAAQAGQQALRKGAFEFRVRAAMSAGGYVTRAEAEERVRAEMAAEDRASAAGRPGSAA